MGRMSAHDRVDDIVATLTRLGVPDDLDTDETIRPPAGPAPPAHLPKLSVTEAVVPGVEADLVFVSELGAGGMGIVRVAEQRSLARQVAVKSLHGPADPSAQDALLREGVVTGRLEHPNIVPVHQAGWTDADGPIIVMKRIEGVPWRTLIRDPTDPAWADYEGDAFERHLRILIDVCHAVEYAHSHGVVHRDIKPSNVMVGRFGETYLLDWGVAAELEEIGEPADVCGTPGYMAPEQIPGGGPVTFRTDVFQLGATLHEVLTQSPRHVGQDVPARLSAAATAAEYAYPPDVPTRLADLANRACAPDPEDRPPSVAALRGEIESFLRHRGAEETVRMAARKLETLKTLCAESDDDPDHVLRVHQQFSACKFGFEQALQQWPESTAASEGLETTLECMIEHELRANKPGACRLLLADMPRDRPDLRAAVDAALAQQESQANATERLRQIFEDQRFHGNDWSRCFQVTPLENLVALLIALSVEVWLVYVYRKPIYETKVFAKLTVVLFGTTVMLLVPRLVSMARPMPFLDVFFVDMMILLTGVTMGAALVSGALWGTVLAGIVGAVVTAFNMEIAIEVMGTVVLFHGFWVGWAARPRPPD